jgi:DNA recombination protein RmuC
VECKAEPPRWIPAEIPLRHSPFLLTWWHTRLMSSLLLLFLALLAGALAGFFLGRATAAHSARLALEVEKSASALARERAAAAERERDARTFDLLSLREELEQTRLGANQAKEKAAGLDQNVRSLGVQLADLKEHERLALGTASALAEKLQRHLVELEGTSERLKAELVAEQDLGAERLATAKKAEEERAALFAGARVDMANSFEKLAANILEDKSKRFTDHNRANIEQVLHPLRERLGEFQLKVEGLQQDGVVGRTELKTQIEALRGMNEKLSLDANNLVKALKGSSKQQGDWGELILIDMLKDAGLQEGQQFRVQASFANEEGRQSRPDVILNLPGDKHLVIDSKVSLVSYTEHCSCDDEPGRKVLLDQHARSLRAHIDGLSRKAYQTLHQLQSIDFMVMFVPIEPAYLLALAHDGSLWRHAWNKDVLLVSPGTLFPVIRTIAHIWQQERQTRNVEEILKQAGGLYDKVAIFAESFEDVGKKLDSTRGAYDKAFGQLKTGKSNVLGRIGRLKSLGLTASRKMPANFQADEEPDDPEPGSNTPPLLSDASTDSW